MGKALFRSLFAVFALLLSTGEMNASIFGSSDPIDEKLKKVTSTSEAAYKATADVSTAMDKSAEKNFLKDNITVLIPLRNLTKDMSEYFEFLYLAMKMLKSKLTDLKDAKKSAAKASDKNRSKADEKVETLVKEVAKLYGFLVGNGLYTLAAVIKADTTIFLLVMKNSGFPESDVETLKKKFSSIKTKITALDVEISALKEIFEDIEKTSSIQVNKNLINEIIEFVKLAVDILEDINSYYTNKQKLSDNVTNELLKKCSLASGNNNRSGSSSNYDDSRGSNSGNYNDNRGGNRNYNNNGNNGNGNYNNGNYNNNNGNRSGNNGNYDDTRGGSSGNYNGNRGRENNYNNNNNRSGYGNDGHM
ncbi:MAG: hypothetical protein LBT63_02650 [Holosporaceae bacterium]|jgi:hypothetical protein|nr:hypothetical protein [Holosporaceae bacterium]